MKKIVELPDLEKMERIERANNNMENIMKGNKKTLSLFIEAKNQVMGIMNNAKAFNFKYADIVAVQLEINRVIKDKNLQIINNKHLELSNDTYLAKNKMGEKQMFISRGSYSFEIASIYDNEKLYFESPAVWQAEKPADATYGASTSGFRYVLTRAFGIPTLDENDARLKDMENQEKNNNVSRETKKPVEQQSLSTIHRVESESKEKVAFELRLQIKNICKSNTQAMEKMLKDSGTNNGKELMEWLTNYDESTLQTFIEVLEEIE